VQHPNWLDQFLRWLKKTLGLKAERPAVSIVEEYHADGISVLRIRDASIPGCIDLWRIDRHYDRTKFFVCIINIKQLRADLALLGISPKDIAKHRGGKLADHLQQQLQQQESIDATHYWISGWDKAYSGVDKRGRSYQSHRTTDVTALAVDLQGVAGEFAGDRYARRFARKIIKQLAANEFRELEHHRTWQAAVKAIDWAGWLSGLAQSQGGISADHVLQPPRPKRRLIGARRRLQG
jgi:hypothetical protein